MCVVCALIGDVSLCYTLIKYSIISLWAIHTLQSLCSLLQEYQDGRQPSEDATDSFILSHELVYREFVVKHTISSLVDNEEYTARCIVVALEILQSIQGSVYTLPWRTTPDIFQNSWFLFHLNR